MYDLLNCCFLIEELELGYKIFETKNVPKDVVDFEKLLAHARARACVCACASAYQFYRKIANLAISTGNFANIHPESAAQPAGRNKVTKCFLVYLRVWLIPTKFAAVPATMFSIKY